MADASNIAWTDSTANFWMGCFKISPGCKHCYAETLTVNRMGLDVWGPAATTRRQPVKSIWSNIAKWEREAAAAKTRRKVFVMSLGDFMEEHADADAMRPRCWDVMRATKWLDYQVLTKRPDRYLAHLPKDWGDGWPHVWLGTSIESNAYAWRADALRKVPAQVRWISAEPLLGPLDQLDLTSIDWIIVGGESGPGFRAMDHAWARDLRDRCVEIQRARQSVAQTGFGQPPDYGPAFFMKQSAAPRTEMGTYLVEADGSAWAWKQYPRTPFSLVGDYAPPVRVSRQPNL